MLAALDNGVKGSKWVTTQVPNLLRNNDVHSEHLKNGPEKPVSVGANHDI
jgi:hypothetical protein